jgi:hypothetical protein
MEKSHDKEWVVMFHGTDAKFAKSILEKGVLAGQA